MEMPEYNSDQFWKHAEKLDTLLENVYYGDIQEGEARKVTWQILAAVRHARNMAMENRMEIEALRDVLSIISLPNDQKIAGVISSGDLEKLFDEAKARREAEGEMKSVGGNYL